MARSITLGPRGRSLAAAALLGASAAALAACGMLGPTASPVRLEDGDIRLATLVAPPGAPELTARDAAEADAAAARLTPERLAALAERDGARRVPGVQIPFFFGSPLGRAYLETAGPRAIAAAEPPASCPAVGASLGDAATAAAAAGSALGRCLTELAAAEASPGDDACACRLIAADDVLLGSADGYDYARAVSAVARFGDGPELRLIAEEVLEVEGAAAASGDALAGPAAQTLELLGPRGRLGRLVVSADGAARLTIPREGASDRVFTGAWRSEGRRRGWFARTVALSEAGGGAAAAILIGYEPAELDARRDALYARAGR